MAYALKAFVEAIAGGDLSHSGDAVLTRHIGNAYRRPLNTLDDEGYRLWFIQKERSDSPFKIDAAMAAVLSWEARREAVASGAVQTEEPSVYEERGLLTI